jgi:hypothetical protein
MTAESITLLDEVEDLLGELGIGEGERFGVYCCHFVCFRVLVCLFAIAVVVVVFVAKGSLPLVDFVCGSPFDEEKKSAAEILIDLKCARERRTHPWPHATLALP